MHTTQYLEAEELGDVTVLHLRDARITDPMEIEELGRRLYHALEYKNCGKLVIDFTPVEFLSSATIGKLISLNRKAKICRAALRLCNLRSELQDIFHFCNLDHVFDIRANQVAALASF